MTTTIEKTSIQVNSTRFGTLEVEEEIVISLPKGIIGFESSKRYVVLDIDEQNPIKWFQSLDDGSVAFPIIDPWRFKPDYTPTISDADANALGLSDRTPKLVFAIVTIPRDNPRLMTANLLGPVVINPIDRVGKQAIVLDEEYSTKHGILEEMSKIERATASAA